MYAVNGTPAQWAAAVEALLDGLLPPRALVELVFVRADEATAGRQDLLPANARNANSGISNTAIDGPYMHSLYRQKYQIPRSAGRSV
jgi:hypothetical protein